MYDFGVTDTIWAWQVRFGCRKWAYDFFGVAGTI